MRPLRSPFRFAGAVAVVLGLAFVSALSARQDPPFPHERHVGLFPVCTGCHQGMDGDPAPVAFPDPSGCAGCHDGVDRARVSWDGRVERPSNVRFDHGAHAAGLARLGDPLPECAACHSDPAGPRMSVDGGPQLATCWGCHAHQRDEHFTPGPDAECTVCHVPMANSGFPLERLLALEPPPDHGVSDFVSEAHGDMAAAEATRCATCHVQDRCASCHVDVSREPIPSVAPAPPGMQLPEWESEYPKPGTHDVRAFQGGHAPEGGDVSQCSTCHTQDSCMSCHLQPVPDAIVDLPARADVVAPGVEFDMAPPETHGAPFFLSAMHMNLAAVDPGSCATCHTETFCVACHDGPSDGGYHPASFVSRHQADAWGRSQECATCHETAAFCRECHEQSGFASQGRLGAGYHDAEPIWLLRHGATARQSLESCASCHRQSDCVQCHGTLGAFRVNPHAADFDAERAWAQSPRTCIACHTSNPVGSGA